MKTLVVLPSYNEAENIVDLVDRLLATGPSIDVCVVDDSSPDGTAALVASRWPQARSGSGRVRLIVRPGKGGRGSAVRAGLEWGLRSEAAYDSFVEMDCDFSHDPKAVPTGLSRLAAGHDVVLGCRYPRGEIVGWPLHRRAFSLVANTLARMLLSPRIADYTNGFRFYSRRAAECLVDHEQRHGGYIYLSETLSLLLARRFDVDVFPIRFVDRRRGRSNTTLAEVRAAFVGILDVALRHRRLR